MQIKTSGRYLLIPVRMDIMKKTQEITSAGKNIQKREPYRTVGRNVIDKGTMESNVEFSQKIKNRISI